MSKTESKNIQRRRDKKRSKNKWQEKLSFEERLAMLPTQSIRITPNKKGRNVDRIPPDDIIKKIKREVAKTPLPKLKSVEPIEPIETVVEIVEPVQVIVPNLLDQLQNIRERKELQRTERKNSVVVDGFLYLITNPSHPGWVKIGQTSDYEARLSTYQTASPHADYCMIAIKYVEDRRQAEAKFLELAKIVFEVKGEWIKASADELLANF